MRLNVFVTKTSYQTGGQNENGNRRDTEIHTIDQTQKGVVTSYQLPLELYDHCMVTIDNDAGGEDIFIIGMF